MYKHANTNERRPIHTDPSVTNTDRIPWDPPEMHLQTPSNDTRCIAGTGTRWGEPYSIFRKRPQSSCLSQDRGSAHPRKVRTLGCARRTSPSSNSLLTASRRCSDGSGQGKDERQTLQFTQVRATLRCKTLLLLCESIALRGRMRKRVQRWVLAGSGGIWSSTIVVVCPILY